VTRRQQVAQVDVTATEVFVNGSYVMDAEDLGRSSAEFEPPIAVAMGNPRGSIVCLLRLDKMQYRLVKRLMRTCSERGFTDVRFATLPKSATDSAQEAVE